MDDPVPAPRPRRRIALVTPILPVPHDLTRGRYIHETARALSRLATVRVFLPQAGYPRLPGLAPRTFLHGHVGSDYRLDGIEIEPYVYPALPVLSRATNGLAGAWALGPRLRAFGADIVLAYWAYPDGYAALLAARRQGLPCIIGARGSDIHVRSGLGLRLTRQALQGAEAVLTVSQAMRRAAIADYGVEPGKVRTIVNGIDTRVFRPGDRQAARGRLGVAPTAKLVTYVGRFVESKGMRELLAAFQALAARDPDVALALVGDGVMRAQLESMVDAAGLATRVHMPGGLEPAEVAEWVRASDVLTLPSWSEGYPNVVVEAVACGCPVVATDVGGTSEIVNPGNGILVAPRNVPALVQALGDALARHWDRDAMAAACSRGWDAVAMETLAACEHVLGQRRAAVR